jgi:hypothetical protein
MAEWSPSAMWLLLTHYKSLGYNFREAGVATVSCSLFNKSPRGIPIDLCLISIRQDKFEGVP